MKISPEYLEQNRKLHEVGNYGLSGQRWAKKVLPDGRNAHLIQESLAWWLPKLEARFTVSQVKEMSGELAVVVRPL